MAFVASQTALPGVFVIEPKVLGDYRGGGGESFSLRDFGAATGVTVEFVQDHHCRSQRGVLRGLHYQVHQPQGKLMRLMSGSVFDVAVDMRSSSPNFGKWLCIELSAVERSWLGNQPATVRPSTSGKARMPKAPRSPAPKPTHERVRRIFTGIHDCRFMVRHHPLATALLVALAGCSQVNTTPSAATSPPSTTANSLPVISGLPSTQVAVGATYSFTPLARDDDGDALSFSIQNKPAWATFNAATGTLSGVPASSNVGSYSGISITVSDGRTSAALPTFTVIVSQVGAPPGGTAILSWTAPTQNTDGTPLFDLAGYWIYHGTQSGNLQRMQQISGAGTTTFSATGLSSGLHYFAVTAYNAVNAESSLSTVGSKNIP